MRALTVLATALMLSSCAFHHYALIPPPGNTAWSPDPESAVVILGFTTDEPITAFSIANNPESVSLATLLFPENQQNAVAIHMHGGETYQLISAIYYLSQRMDQTRYLTFSDLPAIPLKSGGIYWYGNFYIENEKGAFTSELDPKVIDLSKELYPLVYTHLEPVNF